LRAIRFVLTAAVPGIPLAGAFAIAYSLAGSTEIAAGLITVGFALISFFAGIAAGKILPGQIWSAAGAGIAPIAALVFTAWRMTPGGIESADLLSACVLALLAATGLVLGASAASLQFGMRYVAASGFAVGAAALYLHQGLAESPFSSGYFLITDDVPGWIAASWLFALLYFSGSLLLGSMFPEGGWRWGLFAAGPSLALFVEVYRYFGYLAAEMGGIADAVPGSFESALGDSALMALFALLAFAMFFAAGALGAIAGVSMSRRLESESAVREAGIRMRP
jgi:hypothetical protein